jgi:hypothetical protein
MDKIKKDIIFLSEYFDFLIEIGFSTKTSRQIAEEIKKFSSMANKDAKGIKSVLIKADS